MLRVASSLNGYDIEASDGIAGTLEDLLFDDVSWKLRWLVVDSGDVLNRRRVLIHASFVGLVDDIGRGMQVKLPCATIAEAPGLPHDRPVSNQDEARLYDYYNWDPAWDRSIFGNTMSDGTHPNDPDETDKAEPAQAYRPEYQHPKHHNFEHGVGRPGGLFNTPDRHLRSLREVSSYHIAASDGHIGHLEDVLIDDSEWLIHYLVANTSNWWMGRQVLISPYAVSRIDFSERMVELNIGKDKIRQSPPWDPDVLLDEADRERLHRHYEWPDYWVAGNSDIQRIKSDD